MGHFHSWIIIGPRGRLCSAWLEWTETWDELSCWPKGDSLDFELKVSCLLKTLKDMLIWFLIFMTGTAVYKRIEMGDCWEAPGSIYNTSSVFSKISLLTNIARAANKACKTTIFTITSLLLDKCLMSTSAYQMHLIWLPFSSNWVMSVSLHLAGCKPLVQVIWSAASVQPEGQAHE